MRPPIRLFRIFRLFRLCPPTEPPGSVGTSPVSMESRTFSPLVGSSMNHGAAPRSWRSAARKVRVVWLPCGTSGAGAAPRGTQSRNEIKSTHQREIPFDSFSNHDASGRRHLPRMRRLTLAQKLFRFRSSTLTSISGAALAGILLNRFQYSVCASRPPRTLVLTVRSRIPAPSIGAIGPPTRSP